VFISLKYPPSSTSGARALRAPNFLGFYAKKDAALSPPSHLLFSLYTMKRLIQRYFGPLKKHPVKKYVASLNQTRAARVAGKCSAIGPSKPIPIHISRSCTYMVGKSHLG
jgi:hypothetical protein